MTSPRCILIIIAGGAASGKKSVMKALETSLLSLHKGPGAFTVETLHLSDFLLPTAAADPKQDPERIGAHALPQPPTAQPLTDCAA